MKPAALRMAAGFVVAQGQSFAVGWVEGMLRHRHAAGQLIATSRFPPGSVSFAASQAAVAYCIALEPRETAA